MSQHLWKNVNPTNEAWLYLKRHKVLILGMHPGVGSKQVHVGSFTSLGKLLCVLFHDASSNLETGWQSGSSDAAGTLINERKRWRDVRDRDTYYPLSVLQGKMQGQNSFGLNDMCLM